MSVRVTISSLTPSTPPTNGWSVWYRLKGSNPADPYIQATGSPFATLPIVFDTTDVAGTLYEGYVIRNCAIISSPQFFWTAPCNCTDGTYTQNINNTGCVKTNSIAATVTHSGYCLATAQDAVYTSYGSRIYNAGFSLSTLLLGPGVADTFIYANMASFAQWANTGFLSSIGPMNREGVWIDSDCDGNKDALGVGVQTTIGSQFVNLLGARTIYIGVGADNQFKVVVNGATIVDTGSSASDKQFKIWHLIPVQLVPGLNFFNVIGKGDGTVGDAMAMVVYDNTAAQLLAATDDSQLTILFKSSSLRNTTYDTATCPTGYSLDASGGTGLYVCTRTLTKVCNSIS